MTGGFQDSRPRALTVSELNHQARHLLETSFLQVSVEGELSSLSRPSSGHWYFSLKDKKCQIRCAMFRGFNQRVRELPKEGDQIRIRGKVTIYENRGDFQIIVEHLEPAGVGALQLAFEQLKARLQQEGLFENARKKPIPTLPRHIGVVTSPTGAAFHDILSVLARRCPAIPVTLYPTSVQGKAATSEIVRAIEAANAHGVADLLIIGRGGGSLEDLWCFNEEAVARAIAASALPTVSAVGHEVDVTIADFVADLRAPTPSAAAEKCSPDQMTWIRQLEEKEIRLAGAMKRSLRRFETSLQHLSTRLKDPRRDLLDKAQRMDELDIRLNKAMMQRLERTSVQTSHLTRRLELQSPTKMLAESRSSLAGYEERLNKSLGRLLQRQSDRLQHLAQTLNVVSPLATLGRGYAIVETDEGQIVRRSSSLSSGDSITARVAEGRIHATVTGTSPDSDQTQT